MSNREKLLNEYYSWPDTDGYSNQWAEVRKRWRQKHRGYFSKKCKAWRSIHKEWIKQYREQWRLANPDYYRNYRLKNIERLRKYWRKFKCIKKANFKKIEGY